jgi:hypothetical protein
LGRRTELSRAAGVTRNTVIRQDEFSLQSNDNGWLTAKLTTLPVSDQRHVRKSSHTASTELIKQRPVQKKPVFCSALRLNTQSSDQSNLI